MVFIKKKKCFHVFILGKTGQENVLDDILERKKLLQTIKQQLKKSRKIGVFPKGLVHGFGQKIEIFPSF